MTCLVISRHLTRIHCRQFFATMVSSSTTSDHRFIREIMRQEYRNTEIQRYRETERQEDRDIETQRDRETESLTETVGKFQWESQTDTSPQLCQPTDWFSLCCFRLVWGKRRSSLCKNLSTDETEEVFRVCDKILLLKAWHICSRATLFSCWSRPLLKYLDSCHDKSLRSA